VCSPSLPASLANGSRVLSGSRLVSTQSVMGSRSHLTKSFSGESVRDEAWSCAIYMWLELDANKFVSWRYWRCSRRTLNNFRRFSAEIKERLSNTYTVEFWRTCYDKILGACAVPYRCSD